MPNLTSTHLFDTGDKSVLEYFTNTVDGKLRRVDVHALLIDNKPAHEMPIAQLYSTLAQMGCPRITNMMSKPDLLVRYGIWLQEKVEAAQAEAAAQ